MMTSHAKSPTQPFSAKSKILPLTSVRFFAALYVVLFHTTPGILPQGVQSSILGRILGLGYISVSFFFLLSGFILAFVYLKDGKPVDRRRFYIARVARIYPLYLAAMLLDLPHFIYVQRHIFHWGWGDIAATVVVTSGLVQVWFAKWQGLNFPGWSLSVEAFFYLFFPFVGAALWRMRGRTMILFSILIYGAGVLFVEAMVHTSLSPTLQGYSPLEHFYTFVLGICLAKLFVWTTEEPTRSEALQRYAPWMLAAGVTGYLAAPVFNLPLSPVWMQHGGQVPLFALILLAMTSGQKTIVKVFSANWLVVLGEASFALYLIHNPVHEIMRRVMERGGWPVYLLYLAICIGLSVLSIYCLETPARHWILRKARARSLETEVTSSLAQ